MGRVNLVVLGEYLIDFTSAGKSDNGLPMYIQNPGGAPANVACAASELGCKAGVITKVSNDYLGQFLYKYISDLKIVDLRGIIRSDDPTGLAFAILSDTGERSFQFFRKDCADSMLSKEDINMELLNECDVLHFSSVSLASKVSREATFYAIKEAKKLGKIISFDVNYRPLLWSKDDDARVYVDEALEYADLVKVSEEEAEYFGDKDYDLAAKKLNKNNALVIITFGDKGSNYYGNGFKGTIPSYKVVAKDTTGAGDNFIAAFLTKLIESNKKPNELSEEEIKDILKYSNAAGAINATKYGAINGRAKEEEIQELFNKQHDK